MKPKNSSEYQLNINLQISPGVYILGNRYALSAGSQSTRDSIRHGVMAFVHTRKDFILCHFNKTQIVADKVLPTSDRKGITCKHCISFIQNKILHKKKDDSIKEE